MRKVFLDDLPRKYGVGANKNKLCIDWKNSIGKIVSFIYQDISGELEIINYYIKSNHGYLDIKYNNKIVSIDINSFAKCHIGNLLNKIVIDFRYNIDDIINLKFSDIKILEQIKIPSGKLMHKGYNYACLKCGNKDRVRENDLLEGKGCNVCCVPSKKILIGYNDLWTTHKNIAKLLKYPQDGYEITSGSDKYKIYKCPDCDYEKSYLVHNLIKFGFSCPRCGDGISFANKVGFNLLEQLCVDFIPEHRFHKYRFDFYFELNGEKYDLEMDGALGHGNHNTLSSKTPEETKEEDKIRDNFVNQHNINIIRIDCLKSDLEYIKNNILSSQLNYLFDLSNIDWAKCEEFVNSSLVKTACEHWNNGIKSTKEICRIMKLAKPTIISYLKKGNKLGFCDYNTGKRKVIQLSLENKFIKEWISISEATRELHINNISYCCQNRKNYSHSGGYKWMYKEDYEAMILDKAQ